MTLISGINFVLRMAVTEPIDLPQSPMLVIIGYHVIFIVPYWRVTIHI
jgi:hypothetical protein